MEPPRRLMFGGVAVVKVARLGEICLTLEKRDSSSAREILG